MTSETSVFLLLAMLANFCSVSYIREKLTSILLKPKLVWVSITHIHLKLYLKLKQPLRFFKVPRVSDYFTLGWFWIFWVILTKKRRIIILKFLNYFLQYLSPPLSGTKIYFQSCTWLYFCEMVMQTCQRPNVYWMGSVLYFFFPNNQVLRTFFAVQFHPENEFAPR